MIKKSGGSVIRRRGICGEELAASYLEHRGYTVLERNWRTRQGEIDIIASYGDIVVFAEVKTWLCGDIDSLAYALGASKQKRIVETAKCFLDTYRQYNDRYIRFDVLLIDMQTGMETGEGECRRVYHIVNAFSERV